MDARGFILQASYRILSGVPVVYLYGKLEDGATFLVRDRRQRPQFYIAATDAPSASATLAELGATAVAAPGLSTFDQQPVQRVVVPLPTDAPGVRDRLHTLGVRTFEADVRFAMRYLIDRGIKGSCRLVGVARRGTGVTWVLDEPEVMPADLDVTPRILSFDIETDPRTDRLLAIALYDGMAADEVLIVDPAGRAMPERAVGLPSEREVLRVFCRRVAELDPDVLTGWNVVDFDLTMLARVAARERVQLNLGRDEGALQLRPAQGYFGSGSATVPGRLVLDGIDLVRGAFVRMDEYSLDAVARQVLGEGKAVAGDVRDRVQEILDRYHGDLPAFAHYARTDARLALAIVQQLDLVRLAFARSRLTGMTPDRVAASIASFDFLYLTELGRRGIVAPTVRSDDSRVFAAQAGGHVLEPVTGVHDNVWVFDFKSLYPSIIRTFNIDPLGFIVAGEADEPEGPQSSITMANGARFRRAPGILPQLLDELFPQREAAKASGDEVASQAIKILMNSFYGVLGTPACRFHNPDIANAITSQGRHFLLWCKEWFEAQGYQVLYGDTDSLFVAAGAERVDPDSARAAAERLVTQANTELARYVNERWGQTSRLELEFEKLYLKLFLPSVRHGSGGARKRYAGLRATPTAQQIEFVGMEVVRRDWTELAKDVQRELYERLFAGERVEEFLADVVRRVRAGALDGKLVYRKGLNKPLDRYTASTPPHVAAARKSSAPPGRLISYLVTTAGPEPLDALTHEPDREHYVHKQVRPVAEPVLAALGLSFEQVIGDDRQLGLF